MVWSLWLVVAVSVLVLHPIALVVVRFVVPLVALNTLVAVGGGGLPTDLASWGRHIGAAVMVAIIGLVYRSPYGAVHAQAAAYGHEQRYLLRPPVAVLLPLALLWCVSAGLGAVATRADSLSLALPMALTFFAVVLFTVRRAGVLARRWLVFVPAGIAIHDPLMLRDTFMARRNDVRSLVPAVRVDRPSSNRPGSDQPSRTDNDAFDATGTTWGSPITITLGHPHDLSLSEFGSRIVGTLDRLHVSALRIAPSRPNDAHRAFMATMTSTIDT